MTKTITVDGVMKLRPCHSREWVEACFRGRANSRGRLTVAQIAALEVVTDDDPEEVTDEDKVWLFVRMMGRKMRVLWACDCASRVLPAWESYARGRAALTPAQHGAARTVIRLAYACARGRATTAAVRSAVLAALSPAQAIAATVDVEVVAGAARAAARAAAFAGNAVAASGAAGAIVFAIEAAYSATYSACAADFYAAAAYDAERRWQVARAAAYLERRIGR